MLEGMQQNGPILAAIAHGPNPCMCPVKAVPRLDYKELVAGIQLGDPAAFEKLYWAFHKGIRFLAVRQLGTQDAQDIEHTILAEVCSAIQQRRLREPERLAGFIRTVAFRTIACCIKARVKERRHAELDYDADCQNADRSSEDVMIEDEQREVMQQVLASLSVRDREVLARFYLQEQNAERICAEMCLTETQFRLLKSRAKARFAERGKSRFYSRTQPCARSEAMEHSPAG